MPFLGNTPAQGFAESITKDSFTPNGSTTAFTLSKTAATNSISVFVGNVRQEPTSSYSVSGTTLNMTEAPSTGTSFYVLHSQGTIESTTVLPAGSVVTNSLASSIDLSGKTVTYGLANTDIPTLDHTKMPVGSVIQVVGTKSGAQFSSSSTSYVELTHLRHSITTLSANSKILVNMNVSKQGNQASSSVVGTQIRSSLDNYSAALLTDATAFYPTHIAIQGTDIVLHTAGQAAGTTITYRMYAKVNQGSFYAPDLWGVGGSQSSTILQEIKG